MLTKNQNFDFENPNFDDFVTYKLTNFDQKSIF